MPIYEYKCASCDKCFEELVKNDQTKVKCPDCGQETEKLMSSNNSITSPWHPNVPRGNYTL